MFILTTNLFHPAPFGRAESAFDVTINIISARPNGAAV
jgi:hypothetical protein